MICGYHDLRTKTKSGETPVPVDLRRSCLTMGFKDEGVRGGGDAVPSTRPAAQGIASCIIPFMEFAAVIFITLGILIVGFGLLSLANVFNMSFTKHQREHADITNPGFWQAMVKFMVTGFVIIAIGGIFALLA